MENLDLISKLHLAYLGQQSRWKPKIAFPVFLLHRPLNLIKNWKNIYSCRKTKTKQKKQAALPEAVEAIRLFYFSFSRSGKSTWKTELPSFMPAIFGSLLYLSLYIFFFPKQKNWKWVELTGSYPLEEDIATCEPDHKHRLVSLTIQVLEAVGTGLLGSRFQDFQWGKVCRLCYVKIQLFALLCIISISITQWSWSTQFNCPT